MKRTYIGSPVLPLMTFFLFAASLFLVAYLEHHIVGNETRYVGVVTAVGVICIVAWLGLVIRIDLQERTITRYLFPFFVKTYSLSDVVSVVDESESDFYGKHTYTQIRFKNEDKWNLTMFSRKDVAEIRQML
jgi:prepilin signal peptidase PulO-like enzyme (type II secretory pathway)